MGRKKFSLLWSILVGISFLCCFLLIFNSLTINKNGCSSQEVCSSLSNIRSEKLEDEKCRSACTTKECLDISNYILRNIDLSVNPCEDFYDFACGNYKKRWNYEGNRSTLMNLKDDLYQILRVVIETSEETEFPDGAAQKLKIVYDTCMDTGSSEVTTIRSMQNFLSEIGIPNWPFLSSNFTFVNTTLEEALGKLASYEEYVFVRFYPSSLELFSEEWNGDLYNFTVSPQIQTSYDDSEISDLQETVTGILLYIGVDYENINKTWEDFMNVERGVMDLFNNNSEEDTSCEGGSGDPEDVGSSLSNDTQDDPNQNMLFRVLDSAVRNGNLTSRFSRDRVFIACYYEYYIKRIYDLINSYSHRAIAHYMALRVFINNLTHMNFSIRKNFQYIFREPFEQSDYVLELDKWKFCISWLTNYMKYSLGLVYVPDMWPKEAVDELNYIVDDYKSLISTYIQNQDWIEDTVKAKLVKKVEAEENFIDKIFQLYRNKSAIDAYYKNFHPSTDSFIRNVLINKKLRFTASNLYPLEGLLLRHFSPYEVNAFGGGNIHLAFGIMLPPVFNHGYPKLFNLAKLGIIVGHEIGHTFLYYFMASNAEVDNSTLQSLEERKQCLIDQYFKFELKSLGENAKGNYTVVENFPDNMALQVTEKIAENLLQNMTDEMFALPGLSYSPEELFYISYAQTWCEVRSIEKERSHYEWDRHSSPEFRIIGGLQNSQRFSEVFNCPTASFMNPTKKCPTFN